MTALIIWLPEAGDHDPVEVGGKATNLGRLMQRGFPVPPGFVISTDGYRAFLAENALAADSPDTLRRQILAGPMPTRLRAPIVAAYETLGAPRVAVRSSGTAEDLASASFAGQHDTFLNVSGTEALLRAVRGCWASLWSPSAVAYRQRRPGDVPDPALGVVVQTMVPAEWAGVLFTADPVSGQRDRIVIDAVAGLGDALVSGHASSYHAVVAKPHRRILTADTPVPRSLLTALARYGVAIESAFGAPQDVEWAYADGDVTILQTRPLTALPPPLAGMARPVPADYSRFQLRAAPNLMEHMPVPPYPFDFSLFFRPEMQRSLAALDSLGWEVPPIDAVFIPVADGVVQVIPPRLRPTLRLVRLPRHLLHAFQTDPNAWLQDARSTLVALAERIDAENYAQLSEAELVERIEALQHRVSSLFLRRFACAIPGLLRRSLLTLLLRLTLDKDQVTPLETDLLAAVPSVTTASNQELGRIARRIRAARALREAFVEESPDTLPARIRRLPGGASVLGEIDTFLQRFGYRETVMPGAAFPAWRDDPTIVYGIIKGLVTGPPDAVTLATHDAARAERAEQRLISMLSAGRFGLRRLLRPLVLRTVTASREFIAFREDSHYILFMALAVIRRVALTLGQRLSNTGALDQADNIFLLELSEIKTLGPTAEVKATVERRKAARRSVEGWYTPVPATLLAQIVTNGEIRGMPASRGRVTGPARIIRDSREFWRLVPGEVLVAPYTNPSWTPLFAIASAVVVDTGSIASHAAIVAREYGIPAVMGTGIATHRLHDGERIMVDGDHGIVVPINGDPPMGTRLLWTAPFGDQRPGLP